MVRNDQFQNYKRTQQNGGKPFKRRCFLPIAAVRTQLIDHIRKNECTIVIGETGSGKSTRVPQYILEEGLGGSHLIAVTQPRRVAAISLARRVAEEIHSDVGKKVGYSVRFETTSTDETCIQYMTDGMLLREALYDPSLKRYSVIILDEAHERTLHTDVLFGVVKRAQKERHVLSTQPLPKLKLVIMSATMDVDHFAHYFEAEVLYVEGRLYPIEVLYMPNDDNDYVRNTLITIFQIHRSAKPREDILVFLTGQDEIESVQRKCRELVKELPHNAVKLEICTLYAAMPVLAQMRIFEPTKANHRKVVLATNVAETSLTIPGVKFVIDSGKVKARLYEPSKRVDMLRVVKVSKAQGIQRAGRSGREAPGKCYRLYSEQLYEKLNPDTKPEIETCSLSSVLLELVSMGIKNVNDFDFMDQPSDEAIKAALWELQTLGAMEWTESEQEGLQLSLVGQQLAAFPLDPKFAKMLLAASKLGCLEEIAIIVAMMSTDNVMINYCQKREESQQAHEKFTATEGDHLTLLNVFRAYRKASVTVGPQDSRNWCINNFIHERSIQTVEKIRKQLLQICKNNKLNVGSAGQNKDLIRKALCAGLFLNAAELDPETNNYRLLHSGLNAQIHPSSILHRSMPRTVVFSELVMTTGLYIRDVTVVDAEWLQEAAPEFCLKSRLTL